MIYSIKQQQRAKKKNFAALLPQFSLQLNPVTCSAFLLLIDTVLDAIVLLVDVLVAADLTEHAAGLLGQPTLDQPTRALRQKKESNKLEHGGEHRQTQHVPREGGGY